MIRIALLLSAFFTAPTAFASGPQCIYDNTIYHDGDSFLDDEQCNRCHCEIDRYGREAISCTEMGCFGPKPQKDYTPFKYTNAIFCQKKNDKLDVKWEILLEDQDRDGEFVVNAMRNGKIIYHRNYNGHYLVLTKVQYRDRIRFISPRGTVFLDLTRPYEGKATGYFSTERFGKDVSNLTCKPF
jgi:hypothetical protein